MLALADVYAFVMWFAKAVFCIPAITATEIITECRYLVNGCQHVIHHYSFRTEITNDVL
jgi:hypothetical protein